MTPDPSHGIFTTALNNPDKNCKQKYLPCELYMHDKQLIIIYTADYFFILSVENQRVQLKEEYPGYINASFVDVRTIYHTCVLLTCHCMSTSIIIL